jgi:hypothetical protein
VKGGVAGPVNLVIAFALGATLSAVINLAASMAVGFFGAVLAVIPGAPITLILVIAVLLMALGVWLHLTERHEHEHDAITPSHEHSPDAHHRHSHKPSDEHGVVARARISGSCGNQLGDHRPHDASDPSRDGTIPSSSRRRMRPSRRRDFNVPTGISSRAAR